MNKKLAPMDLAVLTAMSLVILFSVVTIFSSSAWRNWLEAHFIILSCCAITIAVLNAIWMIIGGVKSVLWNWMPPFCLFPNILWVRWLVVFGMLAGTILGIIEGF